MPDNKLIAPHTLAEMIDAYDNASEVVAKCFTDLFAAQDRLNAAFGSDRFYIPFQELHGSVKEFHEKIMKGYTTQAWTHIINVINLRKILSTQRIKEIDRRIDKHEFEDLNLFNILNMLEMVTGESKELLQESIVEVFEYLRIGQHRYDWRKPNHVTNQKNATFDLGPKIILVSVLDAKDSIHWPPPHHVRYNQHDEIRNVDKVFFALDGRSQFFNVNVYQSQLTDAIQTSKDGLGETDYFKFKCYLNGNLHLEFKRLDLLQKINVIGGKHSPSLKGEVHGNNS